MTLTVVRVPGERIESLTGPVYEFFKTLHDLATSGKVVHPGGYTFFGPRGFLSSRVTGIAWTQAERFPGVDPGVGPRMAGVLLVGGELEVARACGLTRVLSQLGFAARHYPCPLWSDRGRPERIPAASNAQSFLSRVRRLALYGVYARMDGKRLKLRILEGTHADLVSALKGLPEDAALALFTQVDPEATGCLVWLPQYPGQNAITSPHYDPGRPSTAGAFLAIAPGIDRNEVVVTEDGFSLLITSEAWRSLRECIVERKPFELSTPGETSFELSWIPQSFTNPVDGQTIFVEDGWTSTSPGAPRPDAPAVIFLTSLNSIDARVERTPFIAYIQQVEDAVLEHRAPELREGLRVQVDLTPGEPPVVRARHGVLSEEDHGHGLDELCSAIARVSAPAVRGGMVAFQLAFKGDREPLAGSEP